MFTDYAPQPTTAGVTDNNIIVRAAEQLKEFFCGLHGHDALLHFEQSRMSLQCASCGYETPGWDLKPTAARAPRQAPRPVVSRVRMPLVQERRVA